MGTRVFEISVKGALDRRLTDEFDDLEVLVDHSLTRLRVVTDDMPALHGVLDRIELLGLELLDVHPIEIDRDNDGRDPNPSDHPAGGDADSPLAFVPSRSPDLGSVGFATNHHGDIAMAIGPVEYIIVGFPGNQFNGQIAPELGKLVDSGTIRVLDLVFITRDADGTVHAVEFEDHDDVALFNAMEGEVGGLISEEDIEYAATELEPNSSAALLVWEDLWARPFVDALRESGAVLIEGSRIPHDLIEAAEAELAAAG